MNPFLLIAIGLLATGLAISLVLLPLAIARNVETGMKYREDLARKLDRLRLGRMLAALGVNINRYLNNERIVDIDRQMRRCSACANTATCDDRLRQGKVAPDNIGFCDNEEPLRKLVHK
jgi:hypothetical protein